MFNYIENDALFMVCQALGLPNIWVYKECTNVADVWIVSSGARYALDSGGGTTGYRLSDYLLATAPVDVNKD